MTSLATEWQQRLASRHLLEEVSSHGTAGSSRRSVDLEGRLETFLEAVEGPMTAATLLAGDARGVLEALPAGSVDACVSSPPYWRHRRYPGSSLGQEATAAEYVEHLVAIFAQVRRVLDPRGVVMLNLGDTFVEKNLQGVPWRVAFGLQDDGWLIRSEVIWQKPNVRPESAKDRPTRDFEHVFMLAGRRDHFFDAAVIREPAEWAHWGRHTSPKARRQESGGSWQSADPDRRTRLASTKTKHPRSVWPIPSENRNVGGMAPMPLALAERLVALSCRAGGTVLDPFMGAGTTGVAAVSSGRSSVGIDVTRPCSRWLEIVSRGSREPLPILLLMHLDGPDPVLLTTRQTADMLGISRRSVAALCRCGTIRAVRLGDGGRWRVLRNSVDESISGVPVQKDWALPQRELQASSPRATEAA